MFPDFLPNLVPDLTVFFLPTSLELFHVYRVLPSYQPDFTVFFSNKCDRCTWRCRVSRRASATACWRCFRPDSVSTSSSASTSTTSPTSCECENDVTTQTNKPTNQPTKQQPSKLHPLHPTPLPPPHPRPRPAAPNVRFLAPLRTDQAVVSGWSNS